MWWCTASIRNCDCRCSTFCTCYIDCYCLFDALLLLQLHATHCPSDVWAEIHFKGRSDLTGSPLPGLDESWHWQNLDGGSLCSAHRSQCWCMTWKEPATAQLDFMNSVSVIHHLFHPWWVSCICLRHTCELRRRKNCPRALKTHSFLVFHSVLENNRIYGGRCTGAVREDGLWSAVHLPQSSRGTH